MYNNISPLPGFDKHGNLTSTIRCSCCGEALDAVPGSDWRLNGTEWEHQCGDPQAGYFPSRNFGEKPIETTWIKRAMKQISSIDIDWFLGIIVKERHKQ